MSNPENPVLPENKLIKSILKKMGERGGLRPDVVKSFEPMIESLFTQPEELSNVGKPKAEEYDETFTDYNEDGCKMSGQDVHVAGVHEVRTYRITNVDPKDTSTPQLRLKVQFYFPKEDTVASGKMTYEQYIAKLENIKNRLSKSPAGSDNAEICQEIIIDIDKIQKKHEHRRTEITLQEITTNEKGERTLVEFGSLRISETGAQTDIKTVNGIRKTTIDTLNEEDRMQMSNMLDGAYAIGEPKKK
jgi:hypothetical protein